MKPYVSRQQRLRTQPRKKFKGLLLLLSCGLFLNCKKPNSDEPSPEKDPFASPIPPLERPLGNENPGTIERRRPEIKELRGVWITNVDSDALESREKIFRAFEFLAVSGFTTVYPVVWNRGYTLYPSPVAKQAFGEEVFPQPAFRGTTEKRDMLKDCVDAGKKYQLEVIPWFEYGLKVPEGHALFKSKPDWFTTTQTGGKTRSDGISFGYLNPAQAEVKQFFFELLTDVVARYDVQGVQLDDHFSLFHEFGYDSRITSLYKQATGKTPPKDTKEKQWVQFRADLISSFLSEIVTAIRAKRGNAIISLSSNAYPWSLENHLQDWPKWLSQGLASEFVLQNYHEDKAKYLAEFENQTLLNALEQSRTKGQYMVMGILSGLRSRKVSANELNQRVLTARTKGYGVSFFFYESLVNLRPTDESPEERKKTLEQLFRIPSAAR